MWCKRAFKEMRLQGILVLNNSCLLRSCFCNIIPPPLFSPTSWKPVSAMVFRRHVYIYLHIKTDLFSVGGLTKQCFASFFHEQRWQSVSLLSTFCGAISNWKLRLFCVWFRLIKILRKRNKVVKIVALTRSSKLNLEAPSIAARGKFEVGCLCLLFDN